MSHLTVEGIIMALRGAVDEQKSPDDFIAWR